MAAEEGKLFVGGLNFDTDEQGLEQHFSSFGPIAEVVVVKDRETQRSRGFGFVTFANPEHASDAMRAMNGEEEVIGATGAAMRDAAAGATGAPVTMVAETRGVTVSASPPLPTGTTTTTEVVLLHREFSMGFSHHRVSLLHHGISRGFCCSWVSCSKVGSHGLQSPWPNPGPPWFLHGRLAATLGCPCSTMGSPRPSFLLGCCWTTVGPPWLGSSSSWVVLLHRGSSAVGL